MRWRQFVVWGFRNEYHTHGHLHYAVHRALSFMGHNALWLDRRSDLSGIDFSETFFFTNYDVAMSLPLREDCFYAVHAGGYSEACRKKFGGLPGFLSFNARVDYQYEYDDSEQNGRRRVERGKPVWLDQDTPFWPAQRHLDMLWATDLTPPEIEANKASASMLVNTGVINYVGSRWFLNESNLDAFECGCRDGGVEFRRFGAGQIEYKGSKVVSHADNMKLVRESMFAPSIVGRQHCEEGFIPERIFKNISYGRFGVTNSAKVNELFGNRLVCNVDPYRLFFEARERLADISMGELHCLMSLVAARHTYVNRLNALLRAADWTE